eukprot:gb/GEZN01013894.1/.p1 GENE.gb/GEZN01013894.1/~~gb/GEZN01013894.1/.p1  ORF type:complete len:238 (+),score=88.90 gb/GEZN01013894.1/:20-733(+)
MPKQKGTKNKGENSKAAEAKARKEKVKTEKATTKKKEEEDAKWSDEGPSKADKRKQEEEEKRLKKLEKEKEKRELQKAEEEAVAKSKKKAPASKVTRADLHSLQENKQKELDRRAKELELAKQNIVHQDLLKPNINQQLREQELRDREMYGDNVVTASSVEEAVRQMKVGDDDADKHPEKRAKAAYKAWEEVNMPRVKEEFPTLKHSQVKQILFKEWSKSPENPRNQGGGEGKSSSK